MNRDTVITKALELLMDVKKQKDLYTALRVAGISASCILAIIGILSVPHDADAGECCYGNTCYGNANWCS